MCRAAAPAALVSVASNPLFWIHRVRDGARAISTEGNMKLPWHAAPDDNPSGSLRTQQCILAFLSAAWRRRNVAVVRVKNALTIPAFREGSLPKGT